MTRRGASLGPRATGVHFQDTGPRTVAPEPEEQKVDCKSLKPAPEEKVEEPEGAENQMEDMMVQISGLLPN